MASDESKSFGSALSRAGLVKGDVLAIMMPNCPQYMIAFLGATGKNIEILEHTYISMVNNFMRQSNVYFSKTKLCISNDTIVL
jgi:long-subunit acyl-CoA synthetase (AMP-forming)